MHEIRFSNPTKKDESVAESSPVISIKESNSKPKNKKIGKMVIMFFVAVILVIGFFYVKDNVKTIFGGSRNNSWSAVFLSNGQVYFGKIDSNNKDEMVLTQVYYLQAEENATPGATTDSLNQSRFKLVKLGSELHGPEDVLIINKNSVIFYEYLREDSRVVESIRDFK